MEALKLAVLFSFIYLTIKIKHLWKVKTKDY